MSLSRTQLHEIERAILIEEVLSSIRHDLRNKLANVRNAVFYIRRRQEQGGAPVEARAAAFLKIIESELAAAAEIVGTGLTLSAKEDSRPIDLLACADYALRIAAPPYTIKIDNQLQPRPGLYGNPEAVALLIRYLLEDTISAMPDGGKLTLSSAEAPTGIVLSVLEERTGEQNDVEPAEQKRIKLLAARCQATIDVIRVSQGKRIDVLLPAASA